MVDLNRLAVLREFAARGTVLATAERLAFSPSAVSQQLAQLQREAQTPLFVRQGRRLVLTDAGRFLATRADTLLADIERLEAELAAFATEATGTVRIAAFQTAVANLVLPALASLRARYPDLEIQISEAEAEVALPALVRGDLDLVVAEEYPDAPRARDARVARTDLLDDELLLALPAGHPALKRTKRQSLASLAGAAWVAPQASTAYAEMIVRLCRSVGGFEPDIRHRASDLELMLNLVSAVGAVTLVPALGRPAKPGVELRRLSGEPYTRTVFVATRVSDAARPATAAVVGALTARGS